MSLFQPVILPVRSAVAFMELEQMIYQRRRDLRKQVKDGSDVTDKANLEARLKALDEFCTHLSHIKELTSPVINVVM